MSTEVAVPFTLPEAEEARRQAWLAERRTGLGASDVAAIFGVSPYKSALALYHEKRGDIEVPIAEQEALYWGRVLQDPIAVRYAHETRRGLEITDPYAIRRHPTHPHILATLDAIGTPQTNAEPTPAPGPGVVEIKNAGFFKREEWRDEPPLVFLIQAQHQMFVTGTQWASVAALVGGTQFFWADISRHDGFIERLVTACNVFWARVQNGDPPPADGSESTRELLKQLYPKTNGEFVTLTGRVRKDHERTWVDVDEKLQWLKKEQKSLAEQRDELENVIRQGIGENVGALLDNGAVWTNKTQSRREFVTKASEFRVLRRKGE